MMEQEIKVQTFNTPQECVAEMGRMLGYAPPTKERIEQERKMFEWVNRAAHVMADHVDNKLCGCERGEQVKREMGWR